MRAMAILYIGPHRRPDFGRDWGISPLLAPRELLAEFPRVLIECGERDPFVDDTVIFAGRVREAQGGEEGVEVVIHSEWSHGYLQMGRVMREAERVIGEQGEWMQRVFNGNSRNQETRMSEDELLWRRRLLV